MVYLQDKEKRTAKHRWGAAGVYLLGAAIVFLALVLGDLRVESRTKTWFRKVSAEEGQHALMEKRLLEQEGQAVYDYITDTRAIAENACRNATTAKEVATNAEAIARQTMGDLEHLQQQLETNFREQDAGKP